MSLPQKIRECAILEPSFRLIKTPDAIGFSYTFNGEVFTWTTPRSTPRADRNAVLPMLQAHFKRLWLARGGQRPGKGLARLNVTLGRALPDVRR